MLLYHATYKQYLSSIIKHGLGNPQKTRNKKNWSDSETGVTYLATDSDIAISYVECSELPENDDLFDNIIVITIDSNKLDANLLTGDKNQIDSAGTYEYHGIITEECFVEINII